MRRNILKDVFFSMLFVVAAGITMAIVVLFVVLSSEFLTEIVRITHMSGFLVTVLGICRWVALVLMFITLLAIVYKITPNKKVSIKSIIPGTLFSAFGLILLTFGFSTYVNIFMKNSIYTGTIGTILMLLLWVYFASIIIVLGAELNSTIDDGKQIERSGN